MFTGIIEATGTVSSLQQVGLESWLTISSHKLDLGDVKAGDSVAVNGCCLTVAKLKDNCFSTYVSQETQRSTTFGSFSSGVRVNLEKAMLATSRFSGHIVSGHIDGVGTILSIKTEGKSLRVEFELPDDLVRYVAAKGSICIDGTSFTVNTVSGNVFSINVIPHTLKETVVGDYKDGQQVNVEVDLVARYLESLIQ
ncbi:MAG: riboflavin synthase [Pseudomonadota bacterium]|nr:riboflavin synthase [Pseudomonadota bacterium]